MSDVKFNDIALACTWHKPSPAFAASDVKRTQDTADGTNSNGESDEEAIDSYNDIYDDVYEEEAPDGDQGVDEDEEHMVDYD